MPIAAGFSLERHTKLVTRNLRFEVGPFNSFQSPGCKFRSTSRSLPVRRRALDPLTIPGAGFVVNQAAKRFGATAKPFSEAREDIPKLSPVNPKTVARETGVFDHAASSWVDASVTQRRFTSPGQAWIVWGPTMQPQETPPLWVLLTLVLIIVSAGMYLTTYLVIEDSRVAVSAETSLLARGLK
jgi:hypothetical protein